MDKDIAEKAVEELAEVAETAIESAPENTTDAAVDAALDVVEVAEDLAEKMKRGSDDTQLIVGEAKATREDLHRRIDEVLGRLGEIDVRLDAIAQSVSMLATIQALDEDDDDDDVTEAAEDVAEAAATVADAATEMAAEAVTESVEDSQPQKRNKKDRYWL